MEGRAGRKADNESVQQSGDNLCQSHAQAQISPGPPVEIPPFANLIYPRRTRLAEMMDKIPKPDGYLPKLHFPNWVDMPLHLKLPGIPMENFFYSRGKLNQPLRRDFRRDYTTVDPHNFFNFLPTGTYNSLHDPATQRYLNRPSVKKLLIQRGLVTSDGEVVCSQKEINEYRQYLEHFQTNVLTADLRSEEEKKLANTSLERELRAYVSINSEYMVRKELADERHRLMLEERIRRLRYKMKEDQATARRNRDKIKEQWEAKRREAKECEAYQRNQRIALKYHCHDITSDQEAINEKHSRARLMAFIVQMQKELVRTLKQSDLMMAKSEHQRQELEKRKEIIAKMTQDRQKKQQHYTKKMERHRAQFPLLTERRKNNERRILQIMRKFLDRWREYVRRRKARRSTPNHLSSWDVEGATRKTVGDIEDMSGYEKFDNFILTLIKMKRDMEEQLEKERAAYEAESEVHGGDERDRTREDTPP